MIRKIWDRVYSDFFMRSRLDEYKQLLKIAIDAGYEVYSIKSFWDNVRLRLDPAKKYLILRHDIDTDVQTAKIFYTIELEFGVVGSYYFRLSTIDVDFMKKIEETGGEASYHFEELATVAKEKRLKTKIDVYKHIEEIHNRFTENLTNLRAITGLPMTIVASHGDFINRYLGMANHELLTENLGSSLNRVGTTNKIS